jgi:hypothetical protein
MRDPVWEEWERLADRAFRCDESTFRALRCPCGAALRAVFVRLKSARGSGTVRCVACNKWQHGTFIPTFAPPWAGEIAPGESKTLEPAGA